MATSRIDPAHLLKAYLTLTPMQTPGGATTASSFAAAVGDARAITGRDADGKVVKGREAEAGRWIGAVAWLCLIEQVGNTLRRTAVKPAKRTSNSANFTGCLEDFGGPSVSKDDREKLWSLRNTLAHDYSLVNDRTQDRFVLDSYRPTAKSKLLAQDQGYTVVNLWALGSLGNNVVYNIKAAQAQGEVEFAADPREVAGRYFMSFGGGTDFFSHGGTFVVGSITTASQAVTGVSVYTPTTLGASVTAEAPKVQ